jgi:nucleotide-binding universal stress UspA family protein
MYRHILVATDFSKGAEAAWDAARNLARIHGADLLLLHVYMEMPGYRFAEVADIQSLYERQRLGVEEALNAQARSAQAGGTTVKALLRTGSPAETIVRVAREEYADLIVVGAHGERGVTSLLVGNVAERVVRLADPSVLIVRRRGE